MFSTILTIYSLLGPWAIHSSKTGKKNLTIVILSSQFYTTTFEKIKNIVGYSQWYDRYSI